MSLGLPVAVFASGAQQARSQIETSGSFGTSINGGSGTQSCISGMCAISGGTDAGSNKFHRFTLFDANRTSESSISGVTIDTDDQSNVILGVASSSNGFNLSVPLSLDSSANLFIVSPDGISLSTGASFSNVTDLTLTNLSTLPIGLSQFSVNSTLSELELLTGTPALSRTNPVLSTVASNAPITIGGVSLTIDGSLYVHANSDLTVFNSTMNAPSIMDVGGALTVTSSTFDNTSQVSLYSLGNLGLYNSTFDGNTALSLTSVGDVVVYNSTVNGNLTVIIDSGNDITIDGSYVVGNGYELAAEQGDVVIDDSDFDIEDNILVVEEFGDVVIDDSDFDIEDNVLDLESEFGDAETEFSEVTDSDLVVVATEADAVTESTFDNTAQVSLYSEENLDTYDSTVDGNTTVSITSVGDIGVYDSSISGNLTVTIDSSNDIMIEGSQLTYNGSIEVSAISNAIVSFSSIEGNDLVISAVNGDAVIEDSSVADTVLDVESESGDAAIEFSEVSDSDVVVVSTEGDSVVADSSIDNAVTDVESESGDAVIEFSEVSDSDVVVVSTEGDSVVADSSIDNTVTDVESESGDAVIEFSEVSDSDVVVVSTEGDSVVADSSIDNTVADVESESGDAVIVDSDVTDTDVVVVSTDGDAVIADSSIVNTVVNVESETGDAEIADSDVIGSDVLAVSSEGDVVVFGSSVEKSVFEAAALTGNIDVSNSEFTNNQSLSFVADFDVSISDSSVSGNQLVVVDAGSDALIDSTTMSDNEGFIMDSNNDLTIVSTKDSDIGSAEVSAGTSLDSDGETTNGTQSNSESTADTSSDSESESNAESATDESSNDNSSTTATNEDASDSQPGESSSGELGESSSPSFQISTLDSTVATSNLRDSIDSNTAEVLSALGLDDISPTPASELTPVKISQSLNDARQVYQSLSLSSLSNSVFSVASLSLNHNHSIALNTANSTFNPAFLNISFTKNSDLGVGDSSKGFIDLTLITSDNTVIGRRTELPVAEFATLLRGFYGKITSQRPLDPDRPSSEASRLYALFLEPLQDVFSSEKISTVLVSADRGLQAIPFSALATRGEFAVENLSFSFTPSLSLTDLSIPLANTDQDEILIMGSTEFSGLAPLPYVNQEVENIAQHYGGKSVLGQRFTSSRVISDLQSSSQSLIHLATHADFKGGKPDESMIYTSDGSISFEAFKSIRRLRRSNPINLFVLSACRSALGDSDSEMGLAGIAVQAGSKSAIGSLWYVDDVATSAFFSIFYRHLSRGVTKSTALTQTQRDFASGRVKIEGSNVVYGPGDVLLSGLSGSQKYNYPDNFQHPFFWSGFVLLGTPW